MCIRAPPLVKNRFVKIICGGEWCKTYDARGSHVGLSKRSRRQLESWTSDPSHNPRAIHRLKKIASPAVKAHFSSAMLSSPWE